jgi:hypothetical protein
MKDALSAYSGTPSASSGGQLTATTTSAALSSASVLASLGGGGGGGNAATAAATAGGAAAANAASTRSRYSAAKPVLRLRDALGKITVPSALASRYPEEGKWSPKEALERVGKDARE